MEHYLDALSKKPGALAGSMPLEHCRAQGRWPESFDRFWAKLEHRHEKQDGTRAMVDVLLLGREHGFERLRAVIEQALEMAYRMWPPSVTYWSWSGWRNGLRQRCSMLDGWRGTSVHSPPYMNKTACSRAAPRR